MELTQAQIEQQDCVDNVVFNLIKMFAPSPDIEWDVHPISIVRDCLEDVLVNFYGANAYEFYPWIMSPEEAKELDIEIPKEER